MQNQVFEIIKGSDVSIPLKIRDSLSKDPIDLTDKVITGVLKGCPENIALTSGAFEIVDAVLGKIMMNLTDTQTALMKTGIQSFEVVLDEGTDKKIVQFTNLLEVKGRI